MTLPSNVAKDAALKYNKNISEPGQTNVRIIDSELKDGEVGSRQFVTLVDVIAEGEIAGFPSALDAGFTPGTHAYNVASLKDIFLNNTQVLKNTAPNVDPQDTDFNFGSSQANRPYKISRIGTADQTRIQGLTETERDRKLSVNVTFASPQTTTITDTSTEGIRVTIGFPRLQKIEDDGSISGVTVEYNIQVKNQAGTLLKKVNPATLLTGLDTEIHTSGGRVVGKSTSPYFKDHIIFLPENIQTSDFPVTVTVTRETADSTDAKVIDAFELTSITELVFNPNNFPNTAVNAIRFDAEVFRSIPTRTYRVRGRKIAIPHNATVRTDGSLSFSGTFNGTLKTDGSGNIQKEYCSDPAWVLYDLLTESRAGFGDFVDGTQIDKYAFYNASVYNSELISDGLGSTSPRFGCHIVIQNETEAYTLLNKIASIMRASLYLDNGSISLTQDRPTDSTYFFSYANVLQGGFVYSGASQRTKDTVINVKYFDNNTRQYDYETVEDTTANQSKYGVVVRTIEAVGCSSRAQARRMGLWHLYTQNNETETVAFATTADAATLIRPGAIISISDPTRTSLRRSGRINTATTTVVTVDNTTDLPSTQVSGDKLSVILSDGTLEVGVISDITGSAITVNSVTRADGSTDTSFTSAPPNNSVWLFERATTAVENYRVLSVKEENNKYTITAMFHNPDKYSFVEDGADLPNRTITTLIDPKPAPSNLSAQELVVVLGNRAVSKIELSWEPLSGVTRYSVKYSFNGGNFFTQEVTSPTFELFDSEIGTYVFEVSSYNAFGIPSVTANSLTFTALGKTAPPAAPTNLTSEPVSENFIRLRFDPSTDVDVTHGGNVVVRHTSDTSTSATFANSLELIPRLPGNVSETLVPALTGTYSVKFLDDTGNLSELAAKIIVTKPDPQPHQVIQTKREDSAFAGSKTRTVYSSELNGLVLVGNQFFDNIDDVDNLVNFDFMYGITGRVVHRGFYTFNDDLDLEAVFNLSLERHFKSNAFMLSNLWDSRRSLVDDMEDWDGTLAEDVNAKLQVATTQGVPTSSLAATYTQSKDQITIARTSHGAAVNDHLLVNFTGGTAQGGFLQVSSVTNANSVTVEATRKLAEYSVLTLFDSDTNTGGELRFYTEGNHGGLSVGDTVRLVMLTGEAVSGEYVVGNLFPFNTVSITTTNNPIVEIGSLEYIKVKDSSGNNVTTSGSCNVSAAFSPFNTFANGEFTARGFRFQAELTSNNPDQNVEIDELGYTASIKRRTETVNTAIASGCATNNAAKTVTFENSFYTGTNTINASTTAFLPTIGITLENAVSGDYFKITSVTGNNFVIETRDSSDAFKDLSFKYTAIGFGKGV